jgi:adenylate kinase family enzyme
MKRVLVIGCSGAGKSTFARKLGARLDLPVVHIDQLFWRPGWVQAPRAEFVAAIAQAAAQPVWVMDGNSPSTFDQRFPRADAIIWLRRNRYLCLYRALRRILGSYGRVRADMAPGCPEKFDMEFFKYIWTFDQVFTARIEAAVAEFGVADRVVHIRSDAEADDFLARLEPRKDI